MDKGKRGAPAPHGAVNGMVVVKKMANSV